MNVCIPPSRVAELKTRLEKGELGFDEIQALLPEEKSAVKALLEDVVTDKLNIKATPEEIQIISQKAKKIDEAQQKLGDDVGDPSKIKENIDFFKAKKEMDDYLQSHNPAPKLRVATGTIGRGMMLASFKSPILNIGSNIEVGLTEGLGRRIASKGLRGADNGLAKDYVKMVNKVYQKTGYDLSRMTSLSDMGENGGRVLDDIVHSQGKGATRKVGRVVEDVVFKQLMGAPDVASGSLHFADSVNLNALKLAKGDKAEATNVMKDAMRLEPQTEAGQSLREQGILDAQVATWTNKTWASRLTQGIRKILNDLSGDVRIGDFVLPFVKTPANVIATGMDYAGGGIPKALINTVKAIRSGNLKDKQYIQGLSRDLTRSGLGLTGAAVIAANLSPDDFMGAYDPARAQIEQLKNSRENSIKVGDKWISTDWLGPLSVPVTAAMYAKKYGNTPGQKAWQYGQGLKSAALNLPGVSDVAGAVHNQTQNKGLTAEEAKSSAINYATSQATARLIPSVLSDVANATDPYQREGSKGLAGVKQKIPGVRESLPVKHDIFGNQVKGENPANELLFGSRVKTDRSNNVTQEIDRVVKANDKPINFTDWDKSSSKSLTEFKQKVGQDKFNKAKIEYGKALQASLSAVFQPGSGYSEQSDAEKLKTITERDTEAQKQVFDKYGFKPTKSKSKKVKLKSP